MTTRRILVVNGGLFEAYHQKWLMFLADECFYQSRLNTHRSRREQHRLRDHTFSWNRLLVTKQAELSLMLQDPVARFPTTL